MEVKASAALSLLLFGAIIFTGHSMADIYKWVDEDGIVHFADHIDKVPLKYQPEVIKREPSVKGQETSPGQKDWGSMTEDEKAEYLRRLREKKKAEDEAKIAGYPEHIQKLIRDHKLEVGMTKEMVLLAWGSPIDIEPQRTGKVQEKWIYPSSQPGRRAYAYFENDLLTGWED